eukprot:12635621-Ditylum_brightwellii.AAC.1
MRKSTNISCIKLAAENNMDPYQDGFPQHLPKLSETEEMFIACAYPVMKIYCLEGGTVGYKGDMLNIDQDIGRLVSSLLQKINQLPIMVVQKCNMNVTMGYKDFRVQHQAIQQCDVTIRIRIRIAYVRNYASV